MKVRILGSGTSSGVPRIGNEWGACDPTEPRNRRTRSALLIEHAGTRILVDTGPDMREQLLAADVDMVDAVIWTHDHADHVFGIDDLRQIYHRRGRPVVGFARPETLARLRQRFDYIFTGAHNYPATVEVHELPDRFTIDDITISVTDQPHGAITSAGLRFDADDASVGYATDFNVMTEAMMTLYQQLDVWVVDALRYRPHPSHPDVPSVLRWCASLRPVETRFIHMDQSMDYATLAATLPSGIAPGYDGWEKTL